VAEGLKALVGLLSVVEARGHPVDGEVGGFDEFWGGPCFRGCCVVAFDMAVDFWELLAGLFERGKHGDGC
jgi:hypothetical protein